MKLRIVFTIAAFFGWSLICLPLRAQNSSGQSEERLQKLEKAVRQLQQRNAELENEVQQLKSRREPFAPILSSPEGKATAGNDHKSVFTEPTPPPVDVHPGG